MGMGQKIFRDAVHADMTFNATEVALIDTAVMQRLRGIKQLGTSSLVYPSAVHSRFEHSLGTCWLAKQIIAAIRQNHAAVGLADPIDSHNEQVITAAALLHDVTHIPYGHTFEDERRIFERHDQNQARLNYFLDQSAVKQILTVAGIYEDVRHVLTANVAQLAAPFIYEIVAGTICADLLDYLQRDALFCGINQVYDRRIFRYFSIQAGHFVIELQKDGLLRHDVLSELIHLLRLRYTLTERVYYHHAKAISGAMISKALELTLARQRLQLEDLYELRDDSFLYLLKTKSNDRLVKQLVEDVETRRLYKRVYLLAPLMSEASGGIDLAAQQHLEQLYHYNRAGERSQAEAELAASLGIPASAVIIYCPAAKMALKEAKVLVKTEQPQPQALSEFQNPEINTLMAKHRALWRFFVCVDRRYEAKFTKAGALCEERFAQPNLLYRQDQRQLSLGFNYWIS
jgi:uncharacterized protein